MPLVRLDLYKIIERFQAFEWDDHPFNWPAFYKFVWKKQCEVWQLADGIRILRIFNEPGEHLNKPGLSARAAVLAAAVKEQHSKALTNDDTAYASKFLKAKTMLKKGLAREWTLYLEGSVVLGIIDLRETHGWRHPMDTEKMRKLIRVWLYATGRDDPTRTDSEWSRALREPEIAALLAAD
jgi:hypothetical protein